MRKFIILCCVVTLAFQVYYLFTNTRNSIVPYSLDGQLLYLRLLDYLTKESNEKIKALCFYYWNKW